MPQDKPILVKDKMGNVIGTRGQQVTNSTMIKSETGEQKSVREAMENNERFAQSERNMAMKPHPRVSSALLRTHNATKML